MFDKLKSRMGEIVNNCGHVVNPVKLFFGYGSAEYMRRALIPKDQIMVLSSEKSKFVDNVQSYLLGYRGMMMTKISREFSVKLAQLVFWYVSLMVSKVSLKRYRLNSPCTYMHTMRYTVEMKKRRGERIAASEKQRAYDDRRKILRY